MVEKHLCTALVSAGLTLAATLLYLNFASGEKLPRLYEADDGEFRRSLSVLLGPPLLEGNRVETLVNGD